MENNAYDIKELAHKLENGTISPEEMAWFEQWYQGFNDEEVLLTGSRHSGTSELKDSIFNRIASQMEAPAQPKRKVISLWRNVAAAAAIVLLVAFAAFYKNAILDIVDPVKQVDLLSKAGQHRQISLPDGTLVWLSPSTRISYPDNFRGAQRLVKLDGEAFFDVKHDATKPFLVHTAGVTTQVLGTSFNVKFYRELPTIQVFVNSGKVEVHDRQHTLGMYTPQQQVTYNKQNQNFSRQTIIGDHALSWMHDDLILDNVEFKEVTVYLQNRYNVNFKYAGKRLSRQHYSVRFSNKLTINQVLDILQFIDGRKYRLNGDVVTIK